MEDKRYYIDSFPYEIELTARICHENARRLLEKYTKEVTIDEFTLLDTIIARPNQSQADLARMILKGKAHTGRFLMALEDKGLIERHVNERGGKLIKVAEVTPKGMEFYERIVKCFKPDIEAFEQSISKAEVEYIVGNLQKLRNAMEKVSKIVFE